MGSLVAVLSNDYWRTTFGSRDVLGQQLRIGSLDYAIIGIAPAGFVGTVQGRPPEIFIPITTVPANMQPYNRNTYFTEYNWDWIEVLVRRKPGVSEAAATAELTAAYRQSRRIQRETNPRVLPDSVARPRAMVAALRSAAGPNPGPESRVLLWAVGVAAHRAAHCLRQCRQPHARPRPASPARDRGAPGARRQPSAINGPVRARGPAPRRPSASPPGWFLPSGAEPPFDNCCSRKARRSTSPPTGERSGLRARSRSRPRC